MTQENKILQRDYSVLVPAGAGRDLGAEGEFIFLKSATDDLVVEILGNEIALSQGNVTRPGKFNHFRIENRTAADVTAVFTVGYGDFRTSEVNGNVVLTSPGTITDGADVTCASGATTLILAANASRSYATVALITGGVAMDGTCRVGGAAVDATHGTPLGSGIIMERRTKAALYLYNNTGAPIVVSVAEDE